MKTVRRWPSASQEESSHQKPNHLGPWSTSLQNCERIHFCYLSHLVCGISWWQPELTCACWLSRIACWAGDAASVWKVNSAQSPKPKLPLPPGHSNSKPFLCSWSYPPQCGQGSNHKQMFYLSPLPLASHQMPILERVYWPNTSHTSCPQILLPACALEMAS